MKKKIPKLMLKLIRGICASNNDDYYETCIPNYVTYEQLKKDTSK